MSSLKFTIYEIPGYIAPGIVGLGALALVVWTAFLPNHALPIAPYSLSKEAIALLVFAAYAIGHLVQGLRNLHPSPEKKAKKNNQHGTLLTGARAGLGLQCGFPLDEYEIEDIVVLARKVPGLFCTSEEETHWTRRAYGTWEEVPA